MLSTIMHLYNFLNILIISKILIYSLIYILKIRIKKEAKYLISQIFLQVPTSTKMQLQKTQKLQKPHFIPLNDKSLHLKLPTIFNKAMWKFKRNHSSLTLITLSLIWRDLMSFSKESQNKGAIKCRSSFKTEFTKLWQGTIRLLENKGISLIVGLIVGLELRVVFDRCFNCLKMIKDSLFFSG